MQFDLSLPLPPSPKVWRSFKEQFAYGELLRGKLSRMREAGDLPHTPLLSAVKVLVEIHGQSRGMIGHYQTTILTLLQRSGVLADVRQITSITVYYCEPLSSEPHMNLRILTKAVRWCRPRLFKEGNPYVHVRPRQAPVTVRFGRPRASDPAGQPDQGVGGGTAEDAAGIQADE